MPKFVQPLSLNAGTQVNKGIYSAKNRYFLNKATKKSETKSLEKNLTGKKKIYIRELQVCQKFFFGFDFTYLLAP